MAKAGPANCSWMAFGGLNQFHFQPPLLEHIVRTKGAVKVVQGTVGHSDAAQHLLGRDELQELPECGMWQLEITSKRGGSIKRRRRHCLRPFGGH